MINRFTKEVDIFRSLGDTPLGFARETTPNALAILALLSVWAVLCWPEYGGDDISASAGLATNVAMALAGFLACTHIVIQRDNNGYSRPHSAMISVPACFIFSLAVAPWYKFAYGTNFVGEPIAKTMGAAMFPIVVLSFAVMIGGAAQFVFAHLGDSDSDSGPEASL